MIRRIWPGDSSFRHCPDCPTRKNAFACAGRSANPPSCSCFRSTSNELFCMAFARRSSAGRSPRNRATIPKCRAGSEIKSSYRITSSCGFGREVQLRTWDDQELNTSGIVVSVSPEPAVSLAIISMVSSSERLKWCRADKTTSSGFLSTYMAPAVTSILCRGTPRHAPK